MKRKLSFAAVLIVLLPALPLRAQTALDSLQMIYDSLDVANIPSGILWDRAPYVPGLHPDPQWYDGSTSAKAGEKGAFYDLLGLFNIAAYHDSIAMPPPDFYDIEDSLFRLPVVNVPLAVMHYDYQEIDSLAVRNGDMGYDTARHKYFDIPGGEPYNDRKTFLGASMLDLAPLETVWLTPYNITYTVSYKLPELMYVTNVSESPTLIEVDFADGNGFVPVQFDQVKTITYNMLRSIWQESPYYSAELRIRMHFQSTGSFNEARVKVVHSVYEVPPDKTMNAADLNLTGSCVVEPEPGFYRSDAKVYVQYGDDTILDRPVIL